MQKLLTVIIFGDRKKSTADGLIAALSRYCDEIEIIGHLGERSEIGKDITLMMLNDRSRFFTVAAGIAKGKYVMPLSDDCAVFSNDFPSFLKALAGADEDVVVPAHPALRHTACVKNSILKNLSVDPERVDAHTYYSLLPLITAYSVRKLREKPFLFNGDCDYLGAYSEFDKFVVSALDGMIKFHGIKDSHRPTQYKAAFDSVCGAAVALYTAGIKLISDKKCDGGKLNAIDKKIKDICPQIYVAAENRFVCGDLKKLRDSGFEKIPLGVKLKVNSELKKNGVK